MCNNTYSMKLTISTTYAVRWQLSNATDYKFTKDGKCINSRTGKLLNMKLKNRCKGYYINGKFQSIASLRPRLEKITTMESPF